MIHAKIQKDLAITLIYAYFAHKIIQMNIHSCLLSMGSNTFPTNSLSRARMELQKAFPGIRFGKEIETEPLFFKTNTNLFHNQLGRFNSMLKPEEIKAIFKEIENHAGRCDSDKESETVKLDIDLLMYDEQVLKKKDMERKYIAYLMNNG